MLVFVECVLYVLVGDWYDFEVLVVVYVVYWYECVVFEFEVVDFVCVCCDVVFGGCFCD